MAEKKGGAWENLDQKLEQHIEIALIDMEIFFLDHRIRTDTLTVVLIQEPCSAILCD